MTTGFVCFGTVCLHQIIFSRGKRKWTNLNKSVELNSSKPSIQAKTSQQFETVARDCYVLLTRDQNPRQHPECVLHVTALLLWCVKEPGCGSNR